MKSNRKLYLLIIVVMILLSLIFFLVFGLDMMKQKREDSVLIVGNISFRNQGGNWSAATLDTDKKQNNWKLFQTYVDNEYFGKYYLYYSDKWYLFSKDKKAVNYDGELLAVNNEKYKVLDYRLNEIDDYTDVDRVLRESDISFIPNYTSNYYIDFDIDNDNTIERLYIVSNLFPLDPVDDKTFFSIVFLKKGDKIIKLYEEKEADAFSGCSASINGILDVDFDNKYEIILKCAYYSTNGDNFSLYNFSKGSFHKLVSN